MMNSDLKACVIGGGSSYTPELIEGFIESQAELPVKQISLMDIDPRRLEIVGGLARRMLSASNAEIELQLTSNREEGIEGSAFIISQIRVGGMAARILDEKIPLRYGVIGQETTGPGGFAKALRTIPVALAIASDIEKYATGGILINFTNPAGLITEALHRYSPVNAIGLCNLPIGAEMRFAKRLGVARNQIALDWVGLNHLNWIRGATLDGEDIWPKVFEQELEEARQNPADGWNFSAELLEQLEMIPCGYLNYYYNRDAVYQESKNAPRSRGEEVQEIEDQLLSMYQNPELKEKPALLEKRGGAFYSKAAVSLIAAVVNDKKELHIVNTANQGALPGLDRQDVVELPCQIGASGAKPRPTEAMPPQIRGLVQAVKAYEQLAAKAGAEGDRQAALQAMLAHPLVPSFQVASDLLEALLQAHRTHLPQFFPEDNRETP